MRTERGEECCAQHLNILGLGSLPFHAVLLSPVGPPRVCQRLLKTVTSEHITQRFPDHPLAFNLLVGALLRTSASDVGHTTASGARRSWPDLSDQMSERLCPAPCLARSCLENETWRVATRHRQRNATRCARRHWSRWKPKRHPTARTV